MDSASSNTKDLSWENFFNQSLEVKKTEIFDIITIIKKSKQSYAGIQKQTEIESEFILKTISNYISTHKNEIIKVISHYTFYSSDWVLNNSIEPVLKGISHLLDSPSARDVSNQTPIGLIGIVTGQGNSFFETSLRILHSLFHRNVCIVKVSQKSSYTQLIWEKIILDCQIQDGTIQFINGEGKEVADFIVKHPGVQAISFTGHRETFLKMTREMPLTSKYINGCFGGKNALCILRIPSATEWMDIIKLMFNTCGVDSHSISRIFILDAIEKEFLIQFQSYLDNYFSEQKKLKSTTKFYYSKEKLLEIKKIILNEGVKIFYEAESLFISKELPNCTDIQLQDLNLPIINITSVKYQYEMPKWINQSSFGHSLFILGDIEKANKIASQAEVSTVYINQFKKINCFITPEKESSFNFYGWALPNRNFCFKKDVLSTSVE